ncbi:hypothetical protein A2U01_0071516, partial [Trifolium medium]|nr:hypothetical protein [Trifolium medium]
MVFHPSSSSHQKSIIVRNPDEDEAILEFFGSLG